MVGGFRHLSNPFLSIPNRADSGAGIGNSHHLCLLSTTTGSTTKCPESRSGCLPWGWVRPCPWELQACPGSQGKACAMSTFTCQTLLQMGVPPHRLLTGHGAIRSSSSRRTPWLCHWQVAETWRAAASPLHSTSSNGRKTLVGVMCPEGRRK